MLSQSAYIHSCKRCTRACKMHGDNVCNLYARLKIGNRVLNAEIKTQFPAQRGQFMPNLFFSFSPTLRRLLNEASPRDFLFPPVHLLSLFCFSFVAPQFVSVPLLYPLLLYLFITLLVTLQITKRWTSLFFSYSLIFTISSILYVDYDIVLVCLLSKSFPPSMNPLLYYAPPLMPRSFHCIFEQTGYLIFLFDKFYLQLVNNNNKFIKTSPLESLYINLFTINWLKPTELWLIST